MGIFIVFVLSRALHPMVIDYSKVTVPVVFCTLLILFTRSAFEVLMMLVKLL